MSQAQLSRLCRPSAPGLGMATESARLRAEAEDTLRDLAFVYHMTQRVKVALVREHPDRTAD